MPNRSLQAKSDRAKRDKVVAGINASLDHLQRYSKATLREVSAIASTIQPSRVCHITAVPLDCSVTKLYNPKQPQRAKTAAMAAYIDCNNELIKRR